MSKPDFEIRFDKARIRLNTALKELENALIAKTVTPSPHHVVHAPTSSDAREQLSALQDLRNEITRLQNSVTNIARERDLLIKENRNLLDNLHKIRSEGAKISNEIEQDLAWIDAIINGEKNERN